MGPKKDAKDTAKELPAGSKFADILVGQRSNPCRITVNLNCNVQILLDAAKRDLIKKLEDKIVQLKTVSIDNNATHSTDTPEGQPVNPNNAVIEKLMEFQSSIKLDNGNIDLIENGVAVGCNQKLNSIAMEDVLVHGSTYVMGRVNTDVTPPTTELFILEDAVARPASGATGKKK